MIMQALYLHATHMESWIDWNPGRVVHMKRCIEGGEYSPAWQMQLQRSDASDVVFAFVKSRKQLEKENMSTWVIIRMVG